MKALCLKRKHTSLLQSIVGQLTCTLVCLQLSLSNMRKRSTLSIHPFIGRCCFGLDSTHSTPLHLCSQFASIPSTRMRSGPRLSRSAVLPPTSEASALVDLLPVLLVASAAVEVETAGSAALPSPRPSGEAAETMTTSATPTTYGTTPPTDRPPPPAISVPSVALLMTSPAQAEDRPPAWVDRPDLTYRPCPRLPRNSRKSFTARIPAELARPATSKAALRMEMRTRERLAMVPRSDLVLGMMLMYLKTLGILMLTRPRRLRQQLQKPRRYPREVSSRAERNLPAPVSWK